MKFIRFSHGNGQYLGILEGDQVISLGQHELLDLLRQKTDLPAFARERAPAGKRFALKEIQYLPPLANPGKIICIGLNYSDHTAESKFEQPAYPTVFNRFSSSLIAHEQPMIRPKSSDSLDYEGEMAVVLSGGGRYISKEDALKHVAGYSIFNDGSVREYQFKSPQWTVGKNFDGTGGFGPALVTADELPPGGAGLALETRLNGKVVQSANTRDMVFDVATLISLLSEAFTLEAGDVIVAGTPSGVGWAREPRLLMQDGDVCEVSIEGVGTLRNPISLER
ncbi:fumarylacetoacetate hydrolase family protein [Achromobacter pestifer]|uniref:Fumarylacetoacetate hydrolase family protein n=1 Tax=Achromobacter pestifer TaxID=1353889 RepID=A0A7D4ICI3_9BURK|nr:fumarylacetoacetate hydrolase family protein [Achromobacter pestifer]QKH38921.1 fumarylacetoacetate hydrolase family protein [Achromobacter pestifer]